MNISNLNQQLQGVYQTYLDTIYSQTWPENVSSPLLMDVFQEYGEMEKKVMFVGQETHGWGNMSGKFSVEKLQTEYHEFDLGKRANYPNGKRYLKSPFWNFSRAFFYNLNKQNVAVSRKTNGFLWTNISKIDHKSTTPSFELQQQNESGFELLKHEIDITKPDVVIFLTGTKYDSWLEKLFTIKNEVIIENGFLSMLHDQSKLLPLLTFKTKHPRTLSSQKMYHAVLQKMTEMATEHN
ncbi:uracil-DNA glycosylase family protein [Larkinella punicea]|uniref:Uracil-DNA glycosylase-like domain-containing protein n=1 Tax=Larkinella punicea TaxID=2315727 RepID=A0A368JVA2_9BACT|nr:uracil-DNA glycosylase family protein [Larkinella punicea]RCR71392.1 hypothetical protein DUE52_00180 [Larkinella punicea]